MNIVLIGFVALSFGTVCSLPAGANSWNPYAPQRATPAPMARGVAIAQREVQIPTDTQLERMEERAITTNPLDDSEARALRGGEESEIRQMDRRAHQIDEQLLTGDGICAGCR